MLLCILFGFFRKLNEGGCNARWSGGVLLCFAFSTDLEMKWNGMEWRGREGDGSMMDGMSVDKYLGRSGSQEGASRFPRGIILLVQVSE